MRPWYELSGNAFSNTCWLSDTMEKEDLRRLLAAPSQVIKVSEAKKVSRQILDGREYYLKRYRYAGLFRSLECIFQKSQARREWDLWQRLRHSGLPIVRHVAMGEWRSGGRLHEAILVTEGFPGVPLDTAAQVHWPSVLVLVRRMHDCGVLHRDLHPGNILLREATGELCLVDLKGIVLRRQLSQAEKEKNLAGLRAIIPIPVTRRVQDLAKRIRKKIYARRSRRCLRTNREFETAMHNGLRWNVRLPFLNTGLISMLDNPERWRVTAMEKLKCGRSRTVVAHQGYVLKCFHHRRWLQGMSELIFSSRGRRAFKKAYHLELLGIPTPRPVATASCRSLCFLSRSYLVTERVMQGRELGQYLREVQQPHPAVIRNVAEMIAMLHEEGFSHSDLKARNILLDADHKCWLLDLDYLQFMRRVSDARAAADLKRLRQDVHLDAATAPGATFLFLRHYFRIRGRRPWPAIKSRIRLRRNCI